LTQRAGSCSWGGGALCELFERTCAEAGRDAAAVLEEVIGADGDVEDFWAGAERNLRAGCCGSCSSPM